MGNRSAAAFDTEDSAELAYWMKNVMPYTEGNDGKDQERSTGSPEYHGTNCPEGHCSH